MDDLVERLIGVRDNHAMMYGDYETVTEAAARIQALETWLATVQRAAKTIMIHEADELRQLRDERVKWHQAIATLDSERQANALLTDRVEALETSLAEAEGRVKDQIVNAIKTHQNFGDEDFGPGLDLAIDIATAGEWKK